MSEIQKKHTNDIVHNFNTMQEAFLNALDIAESSKSTYKRALTQFIAWINAESIMKPNREDILKYKAYLEKQQLSALTRANYLVAVRRLFEWLEGMKIYPNIAKGIKGAKRVKGFKKDPLTISQIRLLLNTYHLAKKEDRRDYAILNILIRTGLRTIEIIRANVGDIQQQSGEAVLWIQGKGRDSKDEFVLLTEGSLKPLMLHLKDRGKVNQEDPLFVSFSDRNRGKRLSTRSISRSIKERLKKIGLNNPRLSAHSLRHFSVTVALKAGCSLQEVQAMARHSSMDTTLIYAHNIDRILNAPERKIDQILSKESEDYVN